MVLLDHPGGSHVIMGPNKKQRSERNEKGLPAGFEDGRWPSHRIKVAPRS